MIYLKEVDRDNKVHIDILFKLLAERTPKQSISHKKMPSYGEHARFVKSDPYHVWYFIRKEDTQEVVGSVYLTRNNELGIFIFNKHQLKGYAQAAVMAVMANHEGPFFANINPANLASKAFFSELGFKFIQETYSHD